jgi:hypothetical protein
MRLTNAGYLGIGTTAPSYPLQVSSSVNTTVSNYGYLNASAPTGVIMGSSGTSPFSIYAAGRILCAEFDAFSDRRIKEQIRRVDNDSAMDEISRLQTVSYEYIDKPAKGDRRKIGFISQQVEDVLPTAVNKTSEFIPNIFKMVTDGSNEVACNTQDILEGDEVRVLTSAGEKIVHVASVQHGSREVSLSGGPGLSQDLSAEHLTLDWGSEQAEGKYFVYGTKVNDFRTIDFDQLTTICVGAIQKLQQDNVQLKTQLEAFQKTMDNNDSAFLAKLAKMPRKERRRLLHDLR